MMQTQHDTCDNRRNHRLFGDSSIKFSFEFAIALLCDVSRRADSISVCRGISITDSLRLFPVIAAAPL